MNVHNYKLASSKFAALTKSYTDCPYQWEMEWSENIIYAVLKHALGILCNTYYSISSKYFIDNRQNFPISKKIRQGSSNQLNENQKFYGFHRISSCLCSILYLSVPAYYPFSIYPYKQVHFRKPFFTEFMKHYFGK